MRDEERYRAQDRCAAIVKACGLEVESVRLDQWPADARNSAGSQLVIDYGGEVTFAILDRLSKAFQTQEIDLSIDRGCPSDPGAEACIIVKNPVVPPALPG